MSKEIILNCEKLERRFALPHNSRLEEYEIDTDTARGDVTEFLEILRQNGVLLED